MTVQLICGDCLEVMPTLEPNSVDTIITDPPYGLEFMGKDWDRGVPGVHFWQEALRVAKPGAIMLAFGGTRTYHRLVCAIEDAGWEIKDTIMWVYGSGFPKSLDISKAIDKQYGAEREVVGGYMHGGTRQSGIKGKDLGQVWHNETAPSTPEAQLWNGWGTALKPACEPICVAMKPLDGTFANNALKWGVAGLWIDGGRVGENPEYKYNADRNGTTFHGQQGERIKQTAEKKGQQFIESSQGRFPANLIHDGSEEVLQGFPQSNGAAAPVAKGQKPFGGVIYGKYQTGGDDGASFYNDSGSASRFFYCAKASRSERNAGLEGMEEKRPDTRTVTGMGTFVEKGVAKQQNHHPTVKPLALMEYLVRLTKTPAGGVVLDPFMGSGTTGIACVKQGREFIGIEMNAEYLEIAEKRIAEAQMQPRLEMAQ